jgi:hypothetical protein
MVEHELGDEKVRVYQEWLERSLTLMGDQFYLLGPDLRCLLVNPPAQTAAGRPESELIGHSFLQVYPDIAGTRFDDELCKALVDREPQYFTFDFPPWGGRVQSALYPTPDAVAVIVSNPSIPNEGMDLTQTQELNSAEVVQLRRIHELRVLRETAQHHMQSTRALAAKLLFAKLDLAMTLLDCAARARVPDSALRAIAAARKAHHEGMKLRGRLQLDGMQIERLSSQLGLLHIKLGYFDSIIF